MKRYIASACMFGALIAPDARAQGLSDTFSEMPRSLSASQVPEGTASPNSSVYVIDSNMITSSGARTIADVLKMVPGVVVGFRFGHWMSVGYHGNTEQTMRRINIVVDDRSIYSPSQGGIVSFNTPVQIEDIERIEVYKGPAHSTFGSNSFGLTIKIFTANAAEKQGSQVIARVGSNNIRDLYVQHGSTFGETQFTTSYYQAQDNGVIDHEDDRLSRQIFFKANHQLSYQDEITFSFGYGESDIDYYQSAKFKTNDHGANDRSWFVLANWRHAWDDGSDLTINASHTVVDRNAHYTTERRAGVGRIRYEPNIAYETNAVEAKVRKRVTETVSFMLGSQLKEDRLDSMNYLSKPRINVLDASGFGHIEWTFAEDWIATVGGMRSYSETSHMTADSYSLDIFHQLNQNHSIRLGYEDGIRQPLVYESYGEKKQYLVDRGNLPVIDVMTTERIYPEKSRIYDLAWSYVSTDRSFNSEVRFYFDDYRNLISHVPVPNPGVVSAFGDRIISPMNIRNPGNAHGVEMSFQWNIDYRTYLASSLTLQDIDSKADTSLLYSSVGESGPSRIFALMTQHEFDGGIRVGGTYNYVSAFNWTRSERIGSQSNVDVYVAKRFYRNKVDARIALDNAFGDESDFSNDVKTPRTLSTSVSFSF